MRKILILFLLFLFSISLFNCMYEAEDIDSTLIVKNLPDGKFFVRVYPTNISSEELNQKYINFSGYVALANGNSPFTLIWYQTISSGDRYVIIEKTSDDYNSPRIFKLNVVSFTKDGDATIDWNDMIDFYPYKK